MVMKFGNHGFAGFCGVQNRGKKHGCSASAASWMFAFTFVIAFAGSAVARPAEVQDAYREYENSEYEEGVDDTEGETETYEGDEESVGRDVSDAEKERVDEPAKEVSETEVGADEHQAGEVARVDDEPEKIPPEPDDDDAEPKKKKDTGFSFGSYGRVSGAGDGHGASAKPINIVSHGTRLEESTYLELDLYYKMRPMKGVVVRTVTTLGFKDDLFHYSGDWTSAMAIRNLYLEATGLFHEGLTMWAGSRLYRGDDIYLLDYWPLDNLNTIGGGLRFRHLGIIADLHGGVNRLRDSFQHQVVPVPGLNNTSEDVTLLDRQRFIGSMKAGYSFGGRNGNLGLKVLGYGEIHRMGSGTYNAHLDDERRIDLPSDQGWLIGAQLGAWGFGQRATHANLFVRYAEGLAAYGEMAVPWGFSNDRTTSGAKEFLLALSGNYEWRMLGVMFGGYLRYFKKAGVNEIDWDNGWEYILTARPHVSLHRNFAQAFEVSYQGKRPFGPEPRTETIQRPGITKLSVIPVVKFGKGTYDRPQFRFVYTMALVNEGARLIYNPEDPRFDRRVQHYIGLQAEWWFNSTYR